MFLLVLFRSDSKSINNTTVLCDFGAEDPRPEYGSVSGPNFALCASMSITSNALLHLNGPEQTWFQL